MTFPATETEEVVYEVECSLDPSSLADFDAWLSGHVREVLACEGFTAAEIQAPVDASPGDKVLRRTQYRVESMAALERYLEQDAPRLRADGVARFGDNIRFSRRVFAPSGVPLALPAASTTCQNCGATVSGNYCAECGQPGHLHALTMTDVAHDVVHSVLHLDSRVWRTLRSLVLRPGELTNEFIRGRRQSYLPPFRLYLILSVMFFALSALLPSGQWLHVNDDGETVVAYGRSTTEANELPAELSQAEGSPRFDLAGPEWLSPLLEEASRKVRADSGRRLGDVFIQTAPKLMFVFLPLMAALALLFYWKPRRLYAEHLVLFLHVHAFLFLSLSVTSVIKAIALLDLPGFGLLGIVTFALVAYLPWYVFRSMRVVYGEGRLRTGLKFIALSVIYFLLLGITMLAGILYSMLSL